MRANAQHRRGRGQGGHRRLGDPHYERNGLLPEAERVSGQRRFTEETVQRLGIIDVAKQAGFSLDEVGILLASIDEGAPAHKQLRVLAERKLPEVDALIERRRCATGSPPPATAAAAAAANRWRAAACSSATASCCN